MSVLGFFLPPSTNGLSKTWFVFSYSLALITPTLLKVLQGKLPPGSDDAWKTLVLCKICLIKLFATEKGD